MSALERLEGAGDFRGISRQTTATSGRSRSRSRAPFNRNPAVTLGHEVAGAIKAIGEDVASWEIGQRVVLQAGQSRGECAMAIKQLYATHYFHTALDVSVCVDDGTGGSAPGFYLLTLKGSQQEGLTGVKGSMLRKVVVDKTRRSLESALASIKRIVEQSSPRS